MPKLQALVWKNLTDHIAGTDSKKERQGCVRLQSAKNCRNTILLGLLAGFAPVKLQLSYTTQTGEPVATKFSSVQSLSRVWLFATPMDCSMPGFPVHNQLPELTHTHVHWVGDAIQPFHPLSSPSPPAFNLSQHQGLFQWVSSSCQVAKGLEFQLQHQSFPWIFRTDFL